MIVNGPPGCGKSTLARMYADEHPLALNLDIDRVRSLIGGWRDDPHAAGLLARAIALAAARAHLAAGHDVVIPQFLGRLAFLEQAEQVAEQAGASFHEIVLLDTKENAVRRYTERTGAEADPDQEMIHQRVGPAELSAMYDRLMAVITARPAAKVVPTSSGQADRAYRDFLRSLTAR